MTNDDIEQREADNAQAAVLRALEILGEHFEAVQILASHMTVNGETVGAYQGRGNWHARRGMAQDFIEKDSAQTLAWEIKNEDDENS
ncbi:MAG: hypothetical protein ACOYM3_27375 [Terrimicrobiaceae bacterium]